MTFVLQLIYLSSATVPDRFPTARRVHSGHRTAASFSYVPNQSKQFQLLCDMHVNRDENQKRLVQSETRSNVLLPALAGHETNLV